MLLFFKEKGTGRREFLYFMLWSQRNTILRLGVIISFSSLKYNELKWALQIKYSKNLLET